MLSPTFSEIPIAHIDDPSSTKSLTAALKAIHGRSYDFSVTSWSGETRLSTPSGRVTYRFVIEAKGGRINLHSGDTVRGPSVGGPYIAAGDLLGSVRHSCQEALWQGDVFVCSEDLGAAKIEGSGTFFEVVTEASSYPAPRLALLRNLPNRPGGCAAYENAFRREALPPDRASMTDENRRGVNRVNAHTLDMRIDRDPPPTRHYHSPVPGPKGSLFDHSETAVVLPRSAYGLPLVAGSEEGHAVIYRNPEKSGTSDSFRVPLRPGSIISTPATSASIFGHSFENAFAMLIAVPGFVAPTCRMG